MAALSTEEDVFRVCIGDGNREIETTRAVLNASVHFRSVIAALPLDVRAIPISEAISFEAVSKVFQFLTLKRSGGAFDAKAFFAKYSDFPDTLLVACDAFGEKNLFDQCAARLKAQVTLAATKLATHALLSNADLEETMRRHAALLNCRLQQHEREIVDAVLKSLQGVWLSPTDVRVSALTLLLLCLQHNYHTSIAKLAPLIDSSLTGVVTTTRSSPTAIALVEQAQLLVVLKHALKREQQRWSAASLYACCKRVGKQHGRLLIEVVLSDDSLSALLAAGLMHQAATACDMDIVQLILLSGRVDVNTVDEYGSSLLLKLLGSSQAVKYLLSLGADPNMEGPFLECVRADRQERGSGGSAEYEAIICTPLHYAIVREDVPLVETLLASGANIESGSRISLKSSREVLREWEERKLEPVLFNIGDKIERSRLRGLSVDMTALGWAVAVPPNMDIIKLLLKHHANPTAALATAVQQRSLVMLELLCKNGADVNDKSADVLRVCIRANFLAGLQWLAHLPVEQRIRATSVGDCLTLAIEQHSHGMVPILVELGADVNRGSLHAAVSANQLESVRVLLDAGADVNLSHPTSAARAIHIAVRETAVKSSGSKRSSTSVSTTVAAADSDATVAVVVDVPLEILRLILAKNADVNVRDGSGLMPLHIAVHSATMMRLLLDAGADVDSVEPRSAQTPLHLAVKFGNIDSVRTLLAAGASVAIWDKTARSALALAKPSGSMWDTLQAYIWKQVPSASSEVEIRHAQQLQQSTSAAYSAAAAKASAALAQVTGSVATVVGDDMEFGNEVEEPSVKRAKVSGSK